MLTGLGARVHLFVRPAYRERFTALFRNTLACNVRELDFGMTHPIVLVMLGDGSAFSVEFSDLAPEEPATVDDAHAHVYFSAPGGQVFRVLDLAYRGP